MPDAVDAQRLFDAEDGAQLLRAVMDAERRQAECLAEVRACRLALVKARRKALEAEWDVTNQRTRWLRATAHLRTDDEGLPLNEPDRSLEISRRNAQKEDAKPNGRKKK